MPPFAPKTYTNGERTEVANSRREEADLRWRGYWLQGTYTPPPPPQISEEQLPDRLSPAELRAALGARGDGAVTLQAALPNLSAALVGYNDVTAPAVRQIDLGSSVGLGPNGALDVTNSVGSRLFARLSPLLNPLGNVQLAHTNGAVGGSVAADWVTQYDTAVAAAGGQPSLVPVIAGMNDGMPAAYHAGQTFPGFREYLLQLIAKAQSRGADVVLFTTPHPHTTRTDWTYGGATTYPGSAVPNAAGSVVQVRNANGVLVPASYRHLRINQALRQIAAETGTLLLDAEHYWFLAVAEHGQDALFDTGQFNHPNLFGFQQSYFRAVDDLTAAFTAPTVRAGVIAGQRNPVPALRTGGYRLAVGNGGTLTVTLAPNTVGRLTIMGTSGGGWQSVWSGSYVTTADHSAIAVDGSAFTAPGQLVEAVTGSTTDTTVAIKAVATGSGSVFTWAADYFVAF